VEDMVFGADGSAHARSASPRMNCISSISPTIVMCSSRIVESHLVLKRPSDGEL